MGGVPEPHTGWTFLTNHARVLAAIAEDQSTRIRDIAVRCRLTERAVQKIISDLVQGGYLTRNRAGRSNTYRIEPGIPLRHPADASLTVSDLLALLARHDAQRGPAPAQAPATDG
ncbi:MarR family transcriptional regulator [Streptomyces yaanensis]|uniref:MarR family transcriptional regulator n=1 Tax=Streptomyces yaanensis TaxID=1142239 RepID=A0ABV7SP66_9ACTN|nr:helix-turn-helix domain-containing protein [Streptomyces sp. CGMCC 4.7035]WNC00281.1 helix-turn-helix domain-containing protein [Streptomyces sp. CGMCC 4.7035]